jgi:hypothetical protein
METTEQIIREAPEIEAYKLALLQAGQSMQMPILPNYQVAGMTGDQTDAIDLGRSGIGDFQAYLNRGQGLLGVGSDYLGQAGQVLQQADTRGQFGGARDVMAQSAVPVGQMGASANLVTQGVPLINQGAQGLTNAQQMANQYSQANMGEALSTLRQGVGSLQGAAGMYDPRTAQQFMNPYNQQVIDESIRQIDRQGDLSRQNLQAQATKAGAFGGSREGVQRAELERGLAEQRNAAIVGGLSQGYNQASTQAQQAFEAQQARQLQQAQGLGGIGSTFGQQALQQAQLGQGSAGLQGNLSGQMGTMAGLYGNLGSQQANIYGQQAQLGQSMAQGIGGLAGQEFGIGQAMSQGLGALSGQAGNLGMQQASMGQMQQALAQNDSNFLYNLGTAQQQQTQAGLDADRANIMQAAQQPYQQLGFLSDLYKGAPSTQMAVTAKNAAAPSPFQQIAGLGTGLLATAGAARSAAGVL